jgi:hypothetical protein
MRRLCLFVLMLGLPACSSDETFDPTGPSGPTIPSIGGTFSSANMYRFEKGGPQPQTFECTGALTIGTQIATAFTGTFLINDPQRCGNIEGMVTDGTYLADGTISFGLTVAGANPNFLTAAFNCTYVSGDQVLRGTLIGTELQAEALIMMDCGPDQGIVSLHTGVMGSR